MRPGQREAYQAAGLCERCTARPAAGQRLCWRHLRDGARYVAERRQAHLAEGKCKDCTLPRERGQRCLLHWHLAKAELESRRTMRGRILRKIVGARMRPIVRAIFQEPTTMLADIARRFDVASTIVAQIRMLARLPPRGRRGPRRRDDVTERATRIRALVAEGMTHAQVASHLGISLNMLRKTLAARRADPWYPRPTSFFQE